MDPKAEQLWNSYFCRASSGWAEAITPEMYKAILSAQPVPVPLPIIEEGRKMFYKVGNFDVNSVAEHINHPGECTKNPYVKQAMLDIKKNDVPWIEAIIKGRTHDYDNVMKIIDEGAGEIQHVDGCYTPAGILDLMDAMFKP